MQNNVKTFTLAKVHKEGKGEQQNKIFWTDELKFENVDTLERDIRIQRERKRERERERET